MKTRKILCLVLVLAFMVSFAVVPSSAADATDGEVYVTVSSQTAAVNDIITVTLSTKNVPALGGLQYTFRWDATKVEPWHKTLSQKAVSGAALINDSNIYSYTYYDADYDEYKPILPRMANHVFDETNPNYGWITAAYSSEWFVVDHYNPLTIPDPTTTNFTLAVMRFRCKDASGSSDFAFAMAADAPAKPSNPLYPNGLEVQQTAGYNLDLAKVDIQQINNVIPPPAAPVGLAGLAPTVKGAANGKITGTTTAMQYSSDDGATYLPCTDVETIGLLADTYLVRYAAAGETPAGLDATVIIPDGPLPIPTAPNAIGLPPVDENGTAGKIINVDTTMEYAYSVDNVAAYSAYTPVTGTEITDLAFGYYKVRVAAVADVNQIGVDKTVQVKAAPKLQDIAPVNATAASDNKYSVVFDPGSFNPSREYEYAFINSEYAPVNLKNIIKGQWGNDGWFETNASGVGTFTPGLINNHVTMPITYYYVAPAYKIWVVIRYKGDNSNLKFIHPMTSTINSTSSLVAQNTFNAFGANINSFFNGTAVEGALSLRNENGTGVAANNRMWPVGIPYEYLLIRQGTAVTNATPGWALTMNKWTNASTKVTDPNYLMYPQNPDGNQLHVRSLNANKSAPYLGFASGGPQIIGNTTTGFLSNDKITEPTTAPAYIKVSVGTNGKITLKDLLPLKYDYILSDSATEPTLEEWDVAPDKFQSSTGTYDLDPAGKAYIHIRTSSIANEMLATSSPTLTLAVPKPLTDATVLRGTVDNGVVSVNLGQATAAVRPNVSYKNWTYTINGVAGTKFYSAAEQNYFAIVKAGDELVFSVTVDSVTSEYGAIVVASTVAPAPLAQITGIKVNRGTVTVGSTTDYEIKIDQGQTSMSFAPITDGTLVAIQPVSNLVYGGDGYYAVVKLADIGKTYTVSVKNSDNVITTKTVKLVLNALPLAEITGVKVNRGTVTAGTDADYEIKIDIGQPSMSFTPEITGGKLVSITPTAKLYYGGDAYYAVVKPTDVGTIYTMTVKNGDNVNTTKTVKLVADTSAADLGSVDIRRGTVSSTVGNVINVTINAGQSSAAVSLIGLDPVCKFTVDNALRSYGGNGLYYAVIKRADVVTAGGTLDINCTLTKTSTGVSQNYIIRATLA